MMLCRAHADQHGAPAHPHGPDDCRARPRRRGPSDRRLPRGPAVDRGGYDDLERAELRRCIGVQVPQAAGQEVEHHSIAWDINCIWHRRTMRFWGRTGREWRVDDVRGVVLPRFATKRWPYAAPGRVNKSPARHLAVSPSHYSPFIALTRNNHEHAPAGEYAQYCACQLTS